MNHDEITHFLMTRPLQVYLEDEDLARLEEWSRKRGWTKSQTIRAAVRALAQADGPGDPLLSASGMIDGLPADVSERFEDYLTATFVAERAAADGRKAKKPRQRLRR